MEDILKWLVTAVLVVGLVIAVVVYVALPAAILILVAGSLFGLGYSSINLWKSGQVCSDMMKDLEGYKDADSRSRCKRYIDEHMAKQLGDDEMYEDISRPSFFFGPCYSFLSDLLKKFFQINFLFRPRFGAKSNRFTTVVYNIWEGGKILGVYVFGTIFSVLLSIITVVAFVLVWAIICFSSGIAIFFDRVYRALHKVRFICPICREVFPLPVYVCPVCGLKHRDLKPGKFGVRHRRCLCGTLLPLTVHAKGQIEDDSGKKSVTLHDLYMICPSPSCRAESHPGVARPTGTLILGPTASGKTCLHAALLHTMIQDFKDSELECEFTDENMERQYRDSEYIYEGEQVRASTRGINGADIIATTFFVSKKRKLAVPRNVYLYDMAGEVFQNLDPQEGMKVFENTDGAIVLLDAQNFLPSEKGRRNRFFGMEDTLDALRQSAALYGKFANNKCTFPLAFTLSKVDGEVLENLVGDAAVRKILEEYPKEFPDYFSAMDYVCRSFLLNQDGGSSFLENIEHDYENVRFFSCSSQGDEFGGQQFQPENVLPIVQWLMLRNDKEFSKAWSKAVSVPDIKSEQRELYKTRSDIYQKYLRDYEDAAAV